MHSYQNPQLPVRQRVQDLLDRMSLRQKIGQLNQRLFGWQTFKRVDQGYQVTEILRKEVEAFEGMGALYGVFRSDPWSGVTLESGIPFEDSVKVTNLIQRYVLDNSPLKIPLLFSEECPHGHQAIGSTLLPTGLGVASSFNPELYRQMLELVGEEMAARGVHLGLIATLDILRDPRWGRAEETLGEDPWLASRFTEAAVTGLSADGRGICPVLKHFAGQGACAGGHNMGPATIGERELAEVHLPAMLAGVRAGARACMAAYNEIDGIPCNANHRLLTEILREKWGFQGIVMADGGAIDRLQMLAGSEMAAAAMALNAGVDMSLWDRAFAGLAEAVENGNIAPELVDTAVSRVLRLKFELGLFEHPFREESIALAIRKRQRARAKNLALAGESMVLLKNEGGMLPLAKSQRVAVIGPNADNVYNQLGDYTPFQYEHEVVTVLDGIRHLVGSDGQVTYTAGCDLRGSSRAGFAEAVQAARAADVAVLVMGGSSARNFATNFEDNGAVNLGDIPEEMDCGEGVDVADLELGGVQAELVQAVAETETPVVMVLIQGRPHALSAVVDHAQAILCGWYPGQEGGTAIAEALFGVINPSGKLPVSIPRSSGQLPVFYNAKDTGRRDLAYRDLSAEPLYPFGFGLSYTSFRYDQIEVSPAHISADELTRGAVVQVSVGVTNQGSRAGSEAVQLYLTRQQASVVRRVRELKGICKVTLQPGEFQEVRLVLTAEELALWNPRMEFVVEPQDIVVWVGTNSQTTAHALLHITRGSQTTETRRVGG